MNQLMALLVTGTLLLLPLAPAAILYLLLSPKGTRAGAVPGNRARGEAGVGPVSILGFRVQFNIVGSTAIYVVLLAVETVIHGRQVQSYTEREVAEARLAQESTKNMQAWLVELPVRLKNGANMELPADNGELQQVSVELEPALTQASANSIRFWVVPNEGRFPSARFKLGTIGLRPTIADLNDTTLVRRDPNSRRMIGIAPIWIAVGPAYRGFPPPTTVTR